MVISGFNSSLRFSGEFSDQIKGKQKKVFIKNVIEPLDKPIDKNKTINGMDIFVLVNERIKEESAPDNTCNVDELLKLFVSNEQRTIKIFLSENPLFIKFTNNDFDFKKIKLTSDKELLDAVKEKVPRKQKKFLSY